MAQYEESLQLNFSSCFVLTFFRIFSLKSSSISKHIISTETHIVPQLSAPIRLQEYGVGIFVAALTKSALKKALKKEYIKVNDRVATTATYINGGETITLCIPEELKPRRKLIFPLRVLFEDDYLAVIHKPAGILVSGNRFITVANALTQNLQLSKLHDATKPQPVHRLDYATTGALLVGKTSSSIRALVDMFEDKAIDKTYFAICIGAMEEKGEVISELEGKKSHSKYEVVKTVPSYRFDQLNLVKLEPKTGRKHQLRIHMASTGHPILGDKDYGVEPLILNGKGLYLHAYSLSFVHPFTKEKLLITDEFPKRFKKVFPELDSRSLD